MFETITKYGIAVKLITTVALILGLVMLFSGNAA